MNVYHYDFNGYYTHASELDDSDKCQITGEFIIPGMATEKEHPIEKEGFEIKFIENEWKYIKLLTDEEKKIQGVLPLEEGELIQDNQLIKIEKPSDLHSWNGSEWYLDEEKVRISRLPSIEEIEKTRIELIVMNLLSEGGMI